MDNSIPVKIIYLDNKQEVHIKSICLASRMLGVASAVVNRALNPMRKKRFNYKGRLVSVRILK
jgi:hypothetical protein